MPFLFHKSFISVAREKEHDDRHSKEWATLRTYRAGLSCDGRACESAVRTRTGVGASPSRPLQVQVDGLQLPVVRIETNLRSSVNTRRQGRSNSRGGRVPSHRRYVLGALRLCGYWQGEAALGSKASQLSASSPQRADTIVGRFCR